MPKIDLYLTEEQEDLLSRLAGLTGVSVGEEIRKAIDARLRVIGFDYKGPVRIDGYRVRMEAAKRNGIE